MFEHVFLFPTLPSTPTLILFPYGVSTATTRASRKAILKSPNQQQNQSQLLNKSARCGKRKFQRVSTMWQRPQKLYEVYEVFAKSFWSLYEGIVLHWVALCREWTWSGWCHRWMLPKLVLPGALGIVLASCWWEWYGWIREIRKSVSKAEQTWTSLTCSSLYIFVFPTWTCPSQRNACYFVLALTALIFDLPVPMLNYVKLFILSSVRWFRAWKSHFSCCAPILRW